MDERAEFNLKLAEERLTVSKKLLDEEFYMDAVNRSYYAIFYTARALVAKDELDFSKHSAVISYFRKNYVKTGIFDVRFSKYIGETQKNLAELFESAKRTNVILFFDEATSALDNRTQAIVTESLNKRHVTRIVVAHRLSTIKDCDRILVMDR